MTPEDERAIDRIMTPLAGVSPEEKDRVFSAVNERVQAQQRRRSSVWTWVLGFSAPAAAVLFVMVSQPATESPGDKQDGTFTARGRGWHLQAPSFAAQLECKGGEGGTQPDLSNCQAGHQATLSLLGKATGSVAVAMIDDKGQLRWFSPDSPTAQRVMPESIQRISLTIPEAAGEHTLLLAFGSQDMTRARAKEAFETILGGGQLPDAVRHQVQVLK